MLRRIEVMVVTGIREELCLQKVGAKETVEGKSRGKERQALFPFPSFWCHGLVFYRSVIHAL